LSTALYRRSLLSIDSVDLLSSQFICFAFAHVSLLSRCILMHFISFFCGRATLPICNVQQVSLRRVDLLWSISSPNRRSYCWWLGVSLRLSLDLHVWLKLKYELFLYEATHYAKRWHVVLEVNRIEFCLIVQSSKLLLVLTSTVILGFGYTRDPWPHFFCRLLRVLKWGHLFDERWGLTTTGHSHSTGKWLERALTVTRSLTRSAT
jgi:hypothetical protein